MTVLMVAERVRASREDAVVNFMISSSLFYFLKLFVVLY